MSCKHDRFEGDVNFERTTDPEKFVMKVAARCAFCKAKFLITASNVNFAPDLFAADLAVTNAEHTELRVPIKRLGALHLPRGGV
jgi:hypothetical protein